MSRSSERPIIDAETLRPTAPLSAPPDRQTLTHPSADAGAPQGRQLTFEQLCNGCGNQATPGVRLRVVLEVLAALQPVHTNLLRSPEQRCHGTLNPGCILINSEGTVSLIWQPMLKPTERQRPYLAPEVRRGSDPDQQADIYSVGVLLYEAMTGLRLGSAAPDACQETVVPWGEPLLDIAMEAMAVAPSRRWASAIGFAEGILAIAKSHVAHRTELCEAVERALSSEIELTLSAPSYALASGRGAEISAILVADSLSAAPARSGELSAVSEISELAAGGPTAGWRRASSRVSRPRRLVPAATWFAMSVAAVLVASFGGFWLGRSEPKVAAVPPGLDNLHAESAPRTGPSERAGAQAPIAAVPGTAVAPTAVAASAIPHPVPTPPPSAATAHPKLGDATAAPSRARVNLDSKPQRQPPKPEKREINYDPEGI